MKTNIFFILLFLILSKPMIGQLKSLDKKKYFDCIVHIDLDLEKPKKYFEESKKYLNTEFIIVRTDSRNKIIIIERGYIKNSKNANEKQIWFESKSINDSLRIKYSFSLDRENHTYYYYADCFDRK